MHGQTSKFHTRENIKINCFNIKLMGGESGAAISQIPDVLGLNSQISDVRPLRSIPKFSRPIVMF